MTRNAGQARSGRPGMVDPVQVCRYARPSLKRSDKADQVLLAMHDRGREVKGDALLHYLHRLTATKNAERFPS